jgi:hypothetical protein
MPLMLRLHIAFIATLLLLFHFLLFRCLIITISISVSPFQAAATLFRHFGFHDDADDTPFSVFTLFIDALRHVLFQRFRSPPFRHDIFAMPDASLYAILPCFAMPVHFRHYFI